MAIGSIIGGTLGAVVGGAPGMAIGSAIGGSIEGGIKNRQAKEAMPPLVDPIQTQLYQQLEQQKRQLESGAAYQAQQDVLKQAGARGMEAATQMAGGGAGDTISALKTMSRATGRNLNELYGTMNLEGLKLTSMMDTLAEKIANRRLQIQQYDMLQKKAEATAALKAGAENLLAYGASNLPVSGGRIYDLLLNKLKGVGTEKDISNNMSLLPPIGGDAITQTSMPITYESFTQSPNSFESVVKAPLYSVTSSDTFTPTEQQLDVFKNPLFPNNLTFNGIGLGE